MSEQYKQRLWRSCKTEGGFLHCAKICESESPFFKQSVRTGKERLFTELIDKKAAIYISHRLSSCKFCDTINVFDNGKIIQTGSHEMLLQDTGGKYYQLWNAQAQYYA